MSKCIPPKSTANQCKKSTRQAATGSKPKRPTLSAHRLVWLGITLSLHYTANWHKTGNAHLEVKAIAPRHAALPITETGYRSEFLKAGLVESAGGPKPYT